MVVASFLVCPENERQQRINGIFRCILEITRAVRQHYASIKLSAIFVGKTSGNIIATMSEIQRDKSLGKKKPVQ
jgi:hypothetical protein